MLVDFERLVSSRATTLPGSPCDLNKLLVEEVTFESYLTMLVELWTEFRQAKSESLAGFLFDFLELTVAVWLAKANFFSIKDGLPC